jgi:hypothetical protein
MKLKMIEVVELRYEGSKDPIIFYKDDLVEITCALDKKFIGRIKSISKDYLLLDCSSNFESDVIKLSFSGMWDIKLIKRVEKEDK